MNWAALFALLIKFLPVIAELLNELFPKARPAGELSGLSSKEGIARAFASLRARTWIWEIGKRAKLRAAEAVATRRADELWATLRFGAATPLLTRGEREEIEQA